MNVDFRELREAYSLGSHVVHYRICAFRQREERVLPIVRDKRCAKATHWPRLLRTLSEESADACAIIRVSTDTLPSLRRVGAIGNVLDTGREVMIVYPSWIHASLVCMAFFSEWRRSGGGDRTEDDLRRTVQTSPSGTRFQ